jgi:SAM-dependent methyltransferase
MKNFDNQVVEDFGNEWSEYTQDELSAEELGAAFNQYFHIFPFSSLPADSRGFDMGCGSGRWANFVASRVGTLTCVDPSSKALEVARRKLSHHSNVRFDCAPVDGASIELTSQDFGYCLGVLHHIPNTQAGIRSCADLLKPGAPFLMYLYYNFENRSAPFRLIWKASDLVRRVISTLPFGLKKSVTSLIALFVYWPLARIALLMHKLGKNVDNIPLSDYKDKGLYFMKTDALDRFGTRLEKRFSRKEITDMLTKAGFERISFSTGAPYWVSIAYKK